MPSQDSYYPDTGEDTQPTGEDNTPDDEQAEGETALLPKSLLAGKDLKVGDEITLKVEHIYEDEVEVCPADSKEEKSEPSAMSEAQGSMDQMAGVTP